MRAERQRCRPASLQPLFGSVSSQRRLLVGFGRLRPAPTPQTRRLPERVLPTSGIQQTISFIQAF